MTTDELRPIDAETILLALDFFRDNMSPALPEAFKVVARGAIEGARDRFLALPQVQQFSDPTNSRVDSPPGV